MLAVARANELSARANSSALESHVAGLESEVQRLAGELLDLTGILGFRRTATGMRVAGARRKSRTFTTSFATFTRVRVKRPPS